MSTSSVTISITRALAELKLLDKRIEKAIQQGQFIGVSVGKKPVKGFQSNEDFSTLSTALLQSIRDLIARRQQIKAAIVASNAETRVSIAGRSMTVAEAIEHKTSIKYQEQLLHKLRVEFYGAHDRAERDNEAVTKRLDSLLESQFAKDGKTKEMDSDAISKPFMEANESRVIDPIQARTVIAKLDDDIQQFLSEVDFVLSESNTITQISVPAAAS